MKLLLCPICGDVQKLRVDQDRTCECQASGGRYLRDGHHAQVWGRAVVIGLMNQSLSEAIRQRPPTGPGPAFEAFVFADEHERISRIAPPRSRT